MLHVSGTEVAIHDVTTMFVTAVVIAFRVPSLLVNTWASWSCGSLACEVFSSKVRVYRWKSPAANSQRLRCEFQIGWNLLLWTLVCHGSPCASSTARCSTSIPEVCETYVVVVAASWSLSTNVLPRQSHPVDCSATVGFVFTVGDADFESEAIGPWRYESYRAKFEVGRCPPECTTRV